ncbi:DUF3108 domain-containing protein [Herbaspirillum sp. YR522]|uniref:DUF3108 domain-containing protein n=1 Tax=Herbaspirillum sp. YR522 TaxID=1144342 RepID=UPI00026FCD56|nr:DUF3108 domain-containing protein [Herbaspirillum sp. YR522]EJN05502.1 Protein of unknown function (DUF3108) [Herbaspirillum sp. YR522]
MSQAFRRPGRWRRALVVIVLTLSLHLFLVHWGRQHLVATAATQDAPAITVQLQPVAPPQQAVSLPILRQAPPSKARPVPPRPPRASREPAIEPPDEPIRETVERVPVAAGTTPASAAEAAAPAAESAAGSATAPAAASEQPAPPIAAQPAEPAAGTHYDTDPPPTARLQYDVLASYNQMPVRGYGTLDWKTDGKTYRLDGRAEDFLFTFLNFSSSGAIDQWGVSPELYTEKRMRRAATNTHFNRERNIINFSSSSETYPRAGGEQDRASLIWQLSAIGRGDASRYRPDAVIDLFVAGVRDGELWRVQVLGQEEIQVPAGTVRTWHVVRMPKPGSYDQRIDIWFAPLHDWYPVRLRYTDTRKDGDYLEMSLSEIKR